MENYVSSKTLKEYSQELTGGGTVNIFELFKKLKVESGCPYLEKNLIKDDKNFEIFGECDDLFANSNLFKGYNIVSNTLYEDLKAI